MGEVKNSFSFVDSLKKYLEKSVSVKSKPHIIHNNGFVFAAKGEVSFDKIFDYIAKYCGDNNFCTFTRGAKHAMGPDHFAGIYAQKFPESYLINITGDEGAVAVLVY